MHGGCPRCPALQASDVGDSSPSCLHKPSHVAGTFQASRDDSLNGGNQGGQPDRIHKVAGIGDGGDDGGAGSCQQDRVAAIVAEQGNLIICGRGSNRQNDVVPKVGWHILPNIIIQPIIAYTQQLVRLLSAPRGCSQCHYIQDVQFYSVPSELAGRV